MYITIATFYKPISNDKSVYVIIKFLNSAKSDYWMIVYMALLVEAHIN